LNLHKGYKSLFYNVGEKLKKDSYIKSIYNKICQINYNKSFEESKRILFNKPTKESYEEKLPDLTAHNIKVHIHNQILQLKNYTNYEMWGGETKDKTEEMKFEECPIRLIKYDVIHWATDDVWYNLRSVSDIVRNRAYYLYMQVLISWSVDSKKIQPDCIADKVNEVVNGHPEAFVLIDYESHIDSYLSNDYKDFRHPKCEGIDYIMCGNIGYIKDTFLYKQLEGKLFIIRKEDLPALIRTSDADVDVTIDDLSNYENNCMDLRVNIDSKYVIKYKRNVCITSLEVIPMRIN